MEEAGGMDSRKSQKSHCYPWKGREIHLSQVQAQGKKDKEVSKQFWRAKEDIRESLTKFLQDLGQQFTIRVSI